jgi:putative aldouronate transport system permease protein
MARFDTRTDKVLLALDYALLVLVAVVMLYPFWQQFVLSVSPRDEALRRGLHLFTLRPSLQGYYKVVTTPNIVRAFGMSVLRVVLGTSISLFFTSLCAYPLSKKYFPLNRTFTGLILFTMMFSGGVIPSYILVKSLGLMNKIWALVLPGAVGAWNLIIMRNFLKSLPVSLEESARMDGASEFTVWRRIVLPLSKPVLATVALWVAVGHWNAYFDALIYVPDHRKAVMQLILRWILLENQQEFTFGQGPEQPGQVSSAPTSEIMKAAIIMVSTLPIVAVYPFLQRYFVTGIMLGSVKE